MLLKRNPGRREIDHCNDQGEADIDAADADADAVCDFADDVCDFADDGAQASVRSTLP